MKRSIFVLFSLVFYNSCSSTSSIGTKLSSQKLDPGARTIANRHLKKPKKLNDGEELFTNAHLEKYLASQKMTLFYFWSPLMPFSLYGAKEARSVAKKLSMNFVPILDLHYKGPLPLDLQSYSSKGNKIYRLGSGQLIEREVENHFPSYLFGDNGKLSHKILFGYITSEKLIEFIKQIKKDW